MSSLGARHGGLGSVGSHTGRFIAGVGVVCKDQCIPALLYADDMVLLAEDEEMLRKELKILGEWCVKWAIKVNVGKCGIVHFRKRRVKRCEEEFRVNGDEIGILTRVQVPWLCDK